MSFLQKLRGSGIAVIVIVALVLLAQAAFAQGNSVLVGSVRDASSKALVPDVVVTVTSPALQGEQTVVTDSAGQYRIPQLPPGPYTIRLEKEAYKPYGRGDINLRVGSTIRVDVLLLPEAIRAEDIVVVGRAPTVDVGSTTTGLSVGADFASRVALSPPSMKGSSTRSFEAVADAAPTAHQDTYGMSFNGTTSPENQYVIDGLSVNSPRHGLLGTPLSMEFVKETNIITGGYMPEYGRATGGVLDVVTKSGSNELHGSVFTGLTLGALEGSREPVKREGQTILTDVSLSSIRDFGFELGGAVLKDKLWFFVGLSPSLSSYRLVRSLNERVLVDGKVQTDDFGLAQVTRVPGSEKVFDASQQTLQYIGKLTYLINQDHNVTLSVYGMPTTSGGDGGFGISPASGAVEVTSIAGTYGAFAHRLDSSSTNVALKSSSSFLNKTLLLDATLGWHHEDADSLPADGSGLGSGEGLAGLARVTFRRSNPTFHSIREFEPVPAGYCEPQPGPPGKDGNPTLIDPCPVTMYSTGGPGLIDETQLNRYQGKAVATWVGSALGHHVVKAGIDVEVMTYRRRKGFTGERTLRENNRGTAFQDFRGGILTGPDMPVTFPVFDATTDATTVGGFLQDSWSILDKVTLNAGLRYDAQIMNGADGELGMVLPHQWSPRVGAIYDFTQEGRSKLFVNFARYYENVPLAIADRAFPGEWGIYVNRRASACDPRTKAGQKSPGCNEPSSYVKSGAPADPNQYWGLVSADKLIVDPELAAQSSDELVLGGEYEILPNVRAGAHYTKRYMNRIIEDLSRDNAASYSIANPGYGIAKDFPKAERDYDALTLHLSKSFSGSWLAQASYTLSYLRGNYSGLFRPENGQLIPNATTEFDLAPLVVNRTGTLPGDRTHQIKLFGARDFTVTRWLAINGGLSYYARSGGPSEYFGSDPIFGSDQVFILPRGLGERLPWVHSFDTHLGATFALSRTSALLVGVDIFNLLNFQAATSVDQRYTAAPVRPIVGGTAADLPVEGPDGTYSCPPASCKLTYADGSVFDPVDRNPNHGNPTSFQPPRTIRFSAKVTF